MTVSGLTTVGGSDDENENIGGQQHPLTMSTLDEATHSLAAPKAYPWRGPYYLISWETDETATAQSQHTLTTTLRQPEELQLQAENNPASPGEATSSNSDRAAVAGLSDDCRNECGVQLPQEPATYWSSGMTGGLLPWLITFMSDFLRWSLRF